MHDRSRGRAPTARISIAWNRSRTGSFSAISPSAAASWTAESSGDRGEEEDGVGVLRSRLPDGLDRIRLVEIEGIDRCTCCGTHVRSTGEIGP